MVTGLFYFLKNIPPLGQTENNKWIMVRAKGLEPSRELLRDLVKPSHMEGLGKAVRLPIPANPHLINVGDKPGVFKMRHGKVTGPITV